MNVVLVEPFGHSEGHGSPYTYKLAKALLNIGHHVHVVSSIGFREDWPANLPVSHTAVLGNRNLYRRGRLARSAHRLRDHIRVQQEAFRIAEKLPDSVVHVIDFEAISLWVAQYLGIAKRRPVVTLGWLSSDLWIPWWRKRDLLSRIRTAPEAAYYGVALNRFVKRIARRAEIVVHSQRIQHRAAELRLIDEATLIPWGTDIRQPAITRESARARLGIAQDACVGIFFGPTRRNKGLELLVRAVARLPRKTVHIIVAGKKTDGVDPVTLAADLGCSSDFTFHLGWIAEADCDLYFKASDFTALPYLPGFDGDSGVLSYACEYGLPVVASDTGELGARVLEHGLGLIFQAGDCDQLAASLLQFATLSPEGKADLSINCAHYTNANSWEAVARQHTAVYEKALNGSRGNWAS